MDRGIQARRYTASVVGGGSGGKLSLAGLAASSRYELVAASRPARRRAGGAGRSATRGFASTPRTRRCLPHRRPRSSACPPGRPRTARSSWMPCGSGRRASCARSHWATRRRRARDILAAIKAAGLPVVVPHGLLQNRHAQEIIARVRGGEIGELELVEIECNRWDIINAGIHWLNFFVNLVPDDPMDWVMAIAEASTQTYRDGMEVETNAITYVQTKKGVRAVMHTGRRRADPPPGQGVCLSPGGHAGADRVLCLGELLSAAQRGAPDGAAVRGAALPGERPPALPGLSGRADRHGTRGTMPSPRARWWRWSSCEGAYLSSAHRCKVTLPLAEFVVPAGARLAPRQALSRPGRARRAQTCKGAET